MPCTGTCVLTMVADSSDGICLILSTQTRHTVVPPDDGFSKNTLISGLNTSKYSSVP